MSSALEMLGLSVLVPAFVAAGVLRFGNRFSGSDPAWRGAVALAAGYAVGYSVLEPRAVLRPSSYWHFLPYVAVVGTLVGGVFASSSRHMRLLSGLIVPVLACVAAWVLFPGWADLRPVAIPYTAALAAYFIVLIFASEPLPRRLRARPWLLILLLVSGAQAASVTACVSMVLGQLNLLTASAVLGCVLGLPDRDDRAHHGITTGWVVMQAGGAFVAAIHPEPPLAALMLFAAVPLVIWLTGSGVLRPALERAGFVVHLAGVVLVTAATLAWLLVL